ncbi:MAG: alpha-E domain-containing protein [Synergistaceae bacterium]|nr:alpha-E domain-containing protein [Synergistaceae bacterium]
MSILSFGNSERLFWLGRYSERVYTGIRSFLGRSGTWSSSAEKTCFDDGNNESLYCSLIFAYDNAIVLRDEIGSDTFSYIQMAVYEMNSAKKSPAPLLHLQKVNDNIAAFWGMADDIISDENVRGIIKLGKRIERVDLYARNNAGNDEIRREVRRLTYRIAKTGLHYSRETLEGLNKLAEAESIDRPEIIRKVESLIKFS